MRTNHLVNQAIITDISSDETTVLCHSMKYIRYSRRNFFPYY